MRNLSFAIAASGLLTGALLAWLTPSDAVAAAPERIEAPLRGGLPDGRTYVYYLPEQSVDWQPFDRWSGLQVRTLSEDPTTGRLAVSAQFPPGWKLAEAAATPQSVEIVMLDGQLDFGGEALGKYDFAFVPPDSQPPSLVSAAGAHALLFFDPPAVDATAVARQRQRGSYVTRFDATRWQPASLAKTAGAKSDLRVMHLKKDPFTTARTWYVKLGPGMTVPWEVHSMVEEGYLMEGAYVMAECLPPRTVIGNYAQGGYFWRAGGIPHSGPESGPRGEVIWLQRSQIALDVTFYGDCAGGQVGAPVKAAADASSLP